MRWCLAFLVACYQPARLDGDAALRKPDAHPPDAPGVVDVAPPTDASPCPTLDVDSAFNDMNVQELQNDWHFTDLQDLSPGAWVSPGSAALSIVKQPSSGSALVAGSVTFSFSMAPQGAGEDGPIFTFVFGSDANDLTQITGEVNSDSVQLSMEVDTSTDGSLFVTTFNDPNQHTVMMSLSDPHDSPIVASWTIDGGAGGMTHIGVTDNIDIVPPALTMSSNGGVVYDISLCY